MAYAIPMQKPLATLPERLREDVKTLWEYHDLGHPHSRCDVGIGLGSHDVGVAVHTARLFHLGLFPLIVFTGARTPTTADVFPRGEAVHYREQAIGLGVPENAILVEPRARNTGDNISFTRDLLAEVGLHPRTVMLVCKPYHQRRAYATCRKLWPDVQVRCAAQSLSLEEYVGHIGDADRVLNMLVGDTQRITEYAERGFAVPQVVPPRVRQAYERLVSAGYTERLV